MTDVNLDDLSDALCLAGDLAGSSEFDATFAGTDIGRSPTAAAGAAMAQLRRYLADERLARQYPEVRFVGLALVFHGWEIAFCDALA